MQIDSFLELARRRRSIRRFKPDPIPDEYVEKILEAGRWAMSGANAQPWEFIVVKDPETKRGIIDTWFEPRMEAYLIEQMRIEELRHQQLLQPPVATPGFKDAPVWIVVVGDRRTWHATVLVGTLQPTTYPKNMANATQNMHLAAAALGLGSQWVSVGYHWGQSLKAILDVPLVLDIHTIVPIGYAAYKPKANYRRELKEIVHYEKYDRSKYRSSEDIIKYLQHLREQTKVPYAEQFSDH